MAAARIVQEGWIRLHINSDGLFLETTSKLALTRRLIEEHRETPLSGLAPVSITLCRLATMLSSAVLRHRAQVGISGPTVLEDFVRVGGQVERQSEFHAQEA